MSRETRKVPAPGKRPDRRPRKTDLRRGAVGANHRPQHSRKPADLSGESLRTACSDLVDEIRKNGVSS